ncbi:capsular polysaccharide export protein (two domain) [Campylobacter iguaniorum]|uniref:capsular polysaccharide biosynthesis protein n=1 Tax=Campylobacter iguaniorum TaxID=1244531 RepID=UPI0007C8ABE8|nr:capsular polysaccharide biosynthesis protein [Campylobacter iguaniorum]ANE35935.1 capsular polysaccharide export protein (two domain) [Campylobacter iguaniorum]
MYKVTTSKKLISNSKYFLDIKHYMSIVANASSDTIFYGWGRKPSGLKAVNLATKFGSKFTLLEDGFIRSVGLGASGARSFSIIEDDIGIYYDATTASRLEWILSSYDFDSDKSLMNDAKWCMNYMREFCISKYSGGMNVDDELVAKYELDKNNSILIIAQTYGDASLEYGLGYRYTTDQMIQVAIDENHGANILLKIHPDVISGKKKSDIDISNLNKNIKIITENINPISLLKHVKKVYTKTSGMGFEALICGCECVCFGVPFYAGWGVSDDRVESPDRRNRNISIEQIFAGAYILYTRYIDAYTYKPTTLKELMPQINKLKVCNMKDYCKTIYLFGFSVWKRRFMLPFLDSNKLVFINTFSKSPLNLAIKNGLSSNDMVYIWGKKDFKDVEAWCHTHKVCITRVEDGFIRSIGLGSDLTRPYSLVFDNMGMYFDTTCESRLEHILNFHKFNIYELEEARELKELLISSKISKYNDNNDTSIVAKQQKDMVLVIGQVEDDASVRIGADGMTNLELLKQARVAKPNSYILYRPHPDVVSGNRVGNVPIDVALKYCDEVSCDTSIAMLLDMADEVHTMTSLTGLEALIRGKKVVSYGRPFWAGWGLSHDTKSISRRFRNLSIDELVAGVYVLYPRYVHPVNLKPCRAKDLILALQIQKVELKKPWKALIHRLYSLSSRIGQKILILILYLVKK